MTELPADLEKKLARSEAKRAWMKAEYWRVRLLLIKTLGGKCCHCGETDIKKLEAHHVEPTQRAGYKLVAGGAYVLREWKKMISGEVPAKLCCHDCHLKIEHNGSTYQLRKAQREQ